MRFRNIEVPPVEPAESAPLLSPERAAARDYSLQVREELIEYQHEWSRRLSETELFYSKKALPFAQTRHRAVMLAEEYGEAESEKDRKRIMKELTAEIKLLRGERTADLEEELREHEEQRRLRTDTPAERKKALASAVKGFESETEENEKIKTIREQISPHKVPVHQALQAYLAEYKNFHTNQKGRGKEPEELKRLENAYYQEVKKYDKALKEELGKSFDARIDEKFTDLGKDEKTDKLAEAWIKSSIRNNLHKKLYITPDYEKLTEEQQQSHLNELTDKQYEALTPQTRVRLLEERAERLKARHASIIKFREVIKPTAEAKYETYKEALGERERGIVSRAVHWSVSRNKAFEEKMGSPLKARIVKAAVTTLVVGVGGVVLGGAVAAGGAIAAAGWGVSRIARVVIGAGLATAAAKIVAEGYGATLGRLAQRSAEKKLSTAGRDRGRIADPMSGDLDIDKLKQIDELRQVLLRDADEQTLKESKLIVQAISSVLFGAGAASVLAGMPEFSGSGMNEPPASVPDEPPPAPGPSPDGVPPPARPDVPDAASSRPPTDVPNRAGTSVAESPARGNAPAEAPTTPNAEIPTIAEGEGAYTLFNDLKEQLEAQYGNDIAHAPRAVRAILENNPHDFSRAFGFLDDAGSRRMNIGETLRMDHGQVVFHDLNSGQDVTLIDRQGHVPIGGDAPYEKIHQHMLPDHPAATDHPARPRNAAPAPEQHGAVSDAEAPTESAGLDATAGAHAGHEGPSATATDVETDNNSNDVDTDTSATENAAQPDPSAGQAEGPSGVNDADTSGSESGTETSQAEASPEPERPSASAAEAFTNRHGVSVNPREVHLYGVAQPNERAGNLLFAYGTDTNTNVTFSRIQELARAHSGQNIYFQSPTLTTINGTSQPWIASGVWTRETGFVATVQPDPTRPDLIGRLNPESFKRVVQ